MYRYIILLCLYVTPMEETNYKTILHKDFPQVESVFENVQRFVDEFTHKMESGDLTDFIDRVSLQNDPKIKVHRKNTRLLDAVETGDTERISRLLKLEASPNATCQLNSVSACHLAVMNENDSLSMLITAGAQSFRTDAFGRTPLHLAAWAGHWKHIAILLDLPKALQNKLSHKTSQKVLSEIKALCLGQQKLLDLPCLKSKLLELPTQWSDSLEHNCLQFTKYLPEIEAGWTALHLASARAHAACVRLLIAAGANPCAQDIIGITPLDVVGAAYYSGLYDIDAKQFYKTIVILIAADGKLKNYRRNDQCKLNIPLHTAVELKSEEAIRKLLEVGASVTDLNTDGLTVLHMCVKKQLKEHLQLLVNFEYNTPNHDVIDAVDKDGLTVLHTAVKAKWLDGIRIALGAGANIFQQANDGASPFHYAAAIGDIQIFQALFSFAKYSIDQQDCLGQTALFIAIARNHLDIVKILVESDCSFVTKMPNGNTVNVLHIAAKNGHTEVLQYLLNYASNKTEGLINEISLKDRRTPLFYAAINNHNKCVLLLLQKGALIDLLLPSEVNIEAETTVLHIAAANNNIQLAKIILLFDSKIINKKNSAGVSPIHEACFHGYRDIITFFLHNGADLSAQYHGGKTSIQLIMNILQKPTEYMQEIFDSYITIDEFNIGDNDCKVKVDYRVLLPNKLDVKEITVLEALINTGNTHGQKRLLHHPLIASFLYLKWKTLLPFFYLIIALYGWFVLSFNMYVMSFFYDIDRSTTESDRPILYQVTMWKIMTYVSTAYTIIQTIFVKIITQKSYFSILDTWLNLLTATLAILLPILVTDFKDHSELIRGVATGAVLLSWIELMFLICRFPNWGFYVLIFGHVTIKVCKVLLTFGFLIIGFSICFMIQFRGKPPFETLWASISKTLVMMTSEYDYSSTIDTSNKYLNEQTDVHITVLRFTFVVFVILASIVLMNLLIAVAVDDVANLKELGNLKMLEKQVDFLASVESFKKYVENTFYKKIYTGKAFMEDTAIYLKPHQTSCKYCKILPVHIKEAIFEKIYLKKKQIDDTLDSMELKNILYKLQDALARQDEKLEQICQHLEKLH